MASKNETTMIISSHDLAHVTEVCGRITLLEAGKIQQDLETSEQTLADLQSFFSKHHTASAT